MVLPSAPKRVALAEAKVVGLRTASRWTEESPPDYVIVQCAWQMAVTSMPLVYVPALLGTELRIYEVERDQHLEGALFELCERFWRRHVLARVPPSPDGSEAARKMLAAVWPKHNAGIVSAPAAAEELAEAFHRARVAEAAAKAEKELAQQKLTQLIGAHEGIESPNFRATWKWQQAAHVAAHTRAAGRVFRFTDLKETGT